MKRCQEEQTNTQAENPDKNWLLAQITSLLKLTNPFSVEQEK